MFIYWAAFIYSGHIYLCLFCLLMFAQTNTPWLSVTTPVCLHHTPNHTLQASLLSLNPHARARSPKRASAELRRCGWCVPASLPLLRPTGPMHTLFCVYSWHSPISAMTYQEREAIESALTLTTCQHHPLSSVSTATLLHRCRAVRGSIGESPDHHCCSNITPTWLQLVSHAFCFSLFLGSWLNFQTRSLASNISIRATSSIGT